MGKDKLKKFLIILMIVFSSLTIISGFFVISGKFSNPGYSIIPMLWTLVLSGFYRENFKKG